MFASVYWAPLYSDWILSWTSTAFNPAGGLVSVPLSQASNYPSAALDWRALLGINGWSTRTAPATAETSLVVLVSNDTGKPQLYALRIPL